MTKDIRESVQYREAEVLHERFRRPGTGQISDAAEVHASPDGKNVVFTAVLVDKLDGAPPTRICRVELESGATQVLTFGPNSDRLPQYAPDGRHVAFLSDRHKAEDFQLYLLDPVGGATRRTPPVDGWVEYLRWSPDSKRILLGVAGYGADISGGQGAVTSKRVDEHLPSWMPTVHSEKDNCGWRHIWVYELATDRVRRVGRTDINIWEAAWCGNDGFVTVASPGVGEGLWYTACLQAVGLETGDSHELYSPQDQLGWPSASPSGKHLAFVEAICSDRWLVAGDLRLIETASGKIQRVDTQGIDITFTEWRSDRKLLLGGHRGFGTIVALYDVVTETLVELWSSEDITTGGRYITASGLNEMGDCVLVGESFVRAPEIAIISEGKYRTVKSFDLGYTDQVNVIDSVERLRWCAPDGLEIQGWLLRPSGPGPHPVVLDIHGGPVWHWRPRWLGRAGLHTLMLLKRGYAVFFPNPRGSTGRGQDFARLVVGDMGGADTYDYLSGLDHLVEKGITVPGRIGVTGGSYGGFMTSWLITQDSRFTAAVPLAQVSNQITEHLISNIPHFVALFLTDRYNNPGGKYFQRSPIMHADRVKTPTLNICGALDRCTPPEESVQFHNALLENGVRSVLVTYPEEGHGVRKWPATIDYAARMVAWFEEHIPWGGPSP
jgi:dipeptidyl aminopeptidase/acylaminoacyl peptidase